MKKQLILFIFTMILGTSVFAQTKIQLRSADKAECIQNDYASLQARFSFSGMEAMELQTERGLFSSLTLSNTVIGGNEGDPQIPVVNELIAVPFGATPRIEITSFSSTDYRLEDYGIHTLVPRQPSLRKDLKPEEVPFVYNEATYQSNRGFRSEPMAIVSVVGTMRGVQLGKMTIEPVSYDPVNNMLRMFNDIEVTVHFDGADAQATEDMLVKTYSPYFNNVYKQLFNGRAVLDAYNDHPDLYTTPVKMLVITTATYANSTAFNDWLTWKKQKGINVDVQTVTSGASASTIRTLIQNKYNTDHPTFLVIIGDKPDVTSYTTYSVSGLNYNPYDSDLQYASVDNDVYHDLYMSRMSVSSTTELGNLVNKILTYEKYTMSDPSYLNNVLLIAGYDGTWADKVGRPTINYAANNYYNTAHGFTNVYKYVTSTYSGCYNYLSSGVGFANYTAHGDIQELANPEFTNSNANSLTNNDKYFWLMANCCLTANWGNSANNPCLGETLIRAANKGAFGYIGSTPESYWYEDYYFGVGATSVMSATPSVSQTTTGVYDAMFDDSGFNTLNSVPFFGNVAVTYAHANGYTSSVTDEYYWRAYQCLGDGSVMPYLVAPAANNVSHATTLPIGASTFTVNADAGSYVSLTKDNEILGVAEVGSTGTVDVTITPVTTAGDVMIVVTRNQRQPYIQTIQAIALNGPYISIDDYTPNNAHVGDNTDLSITFRNVGTDATTGNTTVTLTSNDSNVTFVNDTQSFGSLAANASTTVNGFRFCIATGVADGTTVSLHYTATNGSDTWEGDFVITANEAVLEYQNMEWDGSFTPGETLTLNAKFKNTGHSQATNATATISSTSSYLTISNPTVTVGTIAVDQVVSCQFTVTISTSCPETAQLPIVFTMNADNGLNAQGNETLKNSCNLIFELADSYSGNDGWNNAKLTVSFDDGTPSQDLTIDNGSNSATYTLEIGNGTHVTLTWTKGSYDNECSFVVKYEDGDIVIFQMATSSSPSAGVLYEFDCDCAIASQVFTVNVSSASTTMGTVSGGGEFGYGQSCTVTATASEGYIFTGWTLNGEVVSNEAQYTFNVTSDMNLVANFAEGVTIGNGGTTTNEFLPSYSYYKQELSQQIYTADEIGGACTILSIAFYNAGAEKTRTYDFYLKATNKSTFSSKTDWVTVSNSDKVVSNRSVTMKADEWTTITFDTPFEYDGLSNLVLVTDDNSSAWTNSPHMSCRVFDATSQALYVYSDNTNYNPLSPPTSVATYNEVLSVKNQIIFTKISSTNTYYHINATASPAEGGTISGTGNHIENSTATLTATPAEGYLFWKWTENGEFISDEATISFEVTADRNLVAHFNQIADQTQTYNFGWGWVSFYLDLDLETLENALGTNGTLIKSQDDFVQYENGSWYGTLSGIEVEKMYQISTSASGTLSLTDAVVRPEDHPIQLGQGWNWIGYPCAFENSLSYALGTLQAENDDVMKSHNAMTTYVEGYGWWGTLTQLTPGEGYMYHSATGDKSFVYQNSGRISAIHTADDTNLHWTPDATRFVNNANIIATIGGNIKVNEQTEIGAFVNGECRGAAKLMYVEPFDSYIAFLTVYGNESEQIQFMAYNGDEVLPLEEQVTYTDNMVAGSARQPMVLHAANTDALVFFPNPTVKGQEVVMELPSDMKDATVEVIDLLGRVVFKGTAATGSITAPEVPGIYTIKVSGNGQLRHGKLIVR